MNQCRYKLRSNQRTSVQEQETDDVTTSSSLYFDSRVVEASSTTNLIHMGRAEGSRGRPIERRLTPSALRQRDDTHTNMVADPSTAEDFTQLIEHSDSISVRDTPCGSVVRIDGQP